MAFLDIGCCRTCQPKNPKSKAAKRLIETKTLAETRQAATKKYQHAVQQRSKAFKKTAIDKAEDAARDDPAVSAGYDLWNVRDEKKGTRNERSCANAPFFY